MHFRRLPGAKTIYKYLERRALDVATNLQVCTWNFCFLNMPCKCPPSGCQGVLHEQQKGMVERLKDQTRAQSRLVGSLTSGCGSKVDSVQVELDSLESEVESPKNVVYGSTKQRYTPASQSSGSEVAPTVASKVAFPQKLQIVLNSIPGSRPVAFGGSPFIAGCTNHLCKGGTLAASLALGPSESFMPCLRRGDCC